MSEILVNFLIPVSFFATCAFIVHTAINANMKRRQHEHDERMLALEKGVQVPIAPERRKRYNPYLWPSIFIAVGLGLLIAHIIEGDEDWVWALIPLFMGGSMLYAHIRNERLAGNGKALPAKPASETDAHKSEGVSHHAE